VTRVVLIVLAVAALTCGCGEATTGAGPTATPDGQDTTPRAQEHAMPDSNDGQAGGMTSPAEARPSLVPGPRVDTGVVADQLLVRDAASAYVVDRITAAGGRIVDETATGLRVAFDVDDLDALVRIRDALRAQGVPAQTIAASGVPDDPGAPQ